MNKLNQILKFLPDIFILAGIWILSYNILRPISGGLPSLNFYDSHVNEKVFGIMLIALGLDFLIRKILKNKINKLL
ncbi:MAG: hypothetical protein WC619_01795 [Patescibacteria group bacterium]